MSGIPDNVRNYFLAMLVVPSLGGAAPSSVSGGKTRGLLPSGPTSIMQSTQTGHGGGSRTERIDPRQAPPMDPKREISEQDCTKPVDLTRGNLKCKPTNN